MPNCKLSTLALKFHATTTPNHRALSDARATVDVLHGLFERLGPLGVTTLEEVSTYTSKVTPAQRKKRHLAEHLPDSPGVYLFRDANDDVLYVGTSRNLRTRTRSYFTKAETRTRMGEMVMLAQRIEGIVCATALEAQVRELRLIARHRPPYNRRSKFPEKLTWIKLTREPWPRLSIVRAVLDDDADYIGPFRGRLAADGALTALHDSFRIRQCTPRLAARSRKSPCALAEMGHCLSPCDGSAEPEVYALEVSRVQRAMTADPEDLVTSIRSRMVELARHERFEDAAIWRDRLTGFLRATVRTQRLRELTDQAELVAAAPASRGLGGARDPLRTARRRRHPSARDAPRRMGRRPVGHRRDRVARLRSRRPRRRSRRPSACCAGSPCPASGWSAAPGTHRCRAGRVTWSRSSTPTPRWQQLQRPG